MCLTKANEKKDRYITVIIFSIITAISIYGIFYIGTLSADCHGCGCGLKVMTYATFEEQIENLQEVCGSTQLVKKYSDDRWYVFTKLCNKDGYCKYDYVLLEDCLQGDAASQ